MSWRHRSLQIPHAWKAVGHFLFISVLLILDSLQQDYYTHQVRGIAVVTFAHLVSGRLFRQAQLIQVQPCSACRCRFHRQILTGFFSLFSFLPLTKYTVLAGILLTWFSLRKGDGMFGLVWTRCGPGNRSLVTELNLKHWYQLEDA